MNPRITKKDMALVKGALRRAFARSELHKKMLDAANIEHSDPKRPKVKGWRQCAICKRPEAKSYFVLDHIEPVIRLNESLEDLTIDELAGRMWCEESNLQAVDVTCHKIKTKAENKQRRENKRKKINER